MREELRVDIADLREMSTRWGVSASEQGQGAGPSAVGLSCQASAAAVSAATADITAFTTALERRVRARTTDVQAACARYVANEDDASTRLDV